MAPGNISISPFLFQRCFQQAWSGSRRARIKPGNVDYKKGAVDDKDVLSLPRRIGEPLGSNFLYLFDHF
jgi:hypothetical protein